MVPPTADRRPPPAAASRRQPPPAAANIILGKYSLSLVREFDQRVEVLELLLIFSRRQLSRR